MTRFRRAAFPNHTALLSPTGWYWVTGARSDNRLFFRTTEAVIDAALVCDYLDQFAHGLKKLTVAVLDNAPVNQKQVQKRLRE